MIIEEEATFTRRSILLQTPSQGERRGTQRQLLKKTRTDVQIERTRDHLRYEKNHPTEEKEQSQKNCRGSCPDVGREAQPAGEKSDPNGVHQHRDRRNKRKYRNDRRIFGERDLRNVGANYVFNPKAVIALANIQRPEVRNASIQN